MTSRPSYELIWPGMRVVLGGTADVDMAVTYHLGHVESGFVEAVAALLLFEADQAATFAAHTPPALARESEQRRARVDERRALRAEIRRATPDIDDVHLDLEMDRRRIAAALESFEIPRAVSHTHAFIHARAFMYALDKIGKFVATLPEVGPLPPPAIDACRSFAGVLPVMRRIRDSAQHLEDRARGLGKGTKDKPKPLNLKPIKNEFIDVQRWLNLGDLNGNRYACTTAT